MYTLGVKRDFIARHFLIGGDWGPENFPNSHHYVLELQMEGKELDQHGYLVDIVDVEKHLDEIVNYYKDQMLNEKSEFAGLNPSIEHFSRILNFQTHAYWFCYLWLARCSERRIFVRSQISRIFA